MPKSLEVGRVTTRHDNKIGSVGDNAIKVACLQVKPGYEKDVAKFLDKACERDKRVKQHILVKGLGFYDIIVFYEVDTFEYHLSDYGPTDGITASNSLLCFPYMGTNSNDTFKMLNKFAFTGINMIKLATNENISIDKSEEKLLNYIEDKKIENYNILGTIGWNEIILLIGDNDIQKLSLNMLSLSYEEKLECFIEKTFSIISIRYRIIRNIDVKKDLATVKRKLSKVPSLNKKIPEDIFPSIMISSHPSFYNYINSYWIYCDYTTRDVLGVNDILITNNTKVPKTWSHFLSCLLYFRYKFKDKIFSTSTLLNLRKKIPSNEAYIKKFDFMDIPSPCSTTYKAIPICKFKTSSLKKYFGTKAHFVANNLFSLNSLLQNSSIRGVFNDMAFYPNSILKIGKMYFEEAQGKKRKAKRPKQIYPWRRPVSIEDAGLRMANAITEGIQARSYGIFTDLDHPKSAYSRIRGGVQRAILATEVIPHSIMSKLRYNWDGFISIEDPKFTHINEVIKIPSEALWRPELWWALYHETGHVFLTRVNWVSENEKIIKELISETSRPDLFFNFLEELVAELFGYEIGFFGNYDLYLEVLLEYLADIETTQRKYVDIVAYFLRILFVKIFSLRFIENKINDDQWNDEEYLYKLALAHITECHDIIKNHLDKSGKATELDEPNYIMDKYFWAAGWVITLKKLFNFAKYLNSKIENMPYTFRSNGKVICANDTLAYKQINEGKVWWSGIECPEAVIYELLKDRHNETIKRSIATILSFWNYAVMP